MYSPNESNEQNALSQSMHKQRIANSYSALNFSAKTREKNNSNLNRSVNNYVNLHNYTNQ